MRRPSGGPTNGWPHLAADPFNSASNSTFGAEPENVVPVTPSVDTSIFQVFPSGYAAPLVLPAPAGISVEDTATFDSLLPGLTPTGSVTYSFSGSELAGLSSPTGWSGARA